jgi:phage major head subunit gpT-like protein
MGKHAQRHERYRTIRAALALALADDKPIHGEALAIEWIEAAAGESAGADKPKRFTTLAYTGGPMVVANYQAPVVIDLAGMESESAVPMLMGHDHTAIVGHADSVEIMATQIKAAGAISGIGEGAQLVLATARNGFPWKTSVGVAPQKVEFVRDGDIAKVNGRSVRGPAYIARKSTLQEISFVAVAADSKTSATVAATAATTRKETSMEFKEWVEAMGLVVSELRDDQVAKLQAKYDAEIKAVAKKDGTTIEAAAAKIEAPKFDLSGVVLAYEKHVATVQAKAAGYAGKIADSAKLAEIQATAGTKAAELKAQALNEQWAAPRLESELVVAAARYESALILASLPKGPGIQSSSRDVQSGVIEAALCRSAGLQNLDKHFKPEVLEASDRHFRGGIGLQEVILAAAREGGYDGREKITTANLREVIRAAFSTHTLTTLLSTTGNKMLLDGFMSIPQSWREVAQVKSVNDFKAVTAFRMNSALEYEEVGPAGEITHGTVSQESYSIQVLTFGKMLSLTRQDIINDDLGAFDRIRQHLGLGAAIKLNKLFWTTWLTASDGAAFWTAARTNLVTGSALAEAGLNTAVAAFRDMAGPSGNMMSLEPRILLIPTALEATGKKIYVSQEIRDTTATTKYPTANIYQNSFRPVVVPELGNIAFTGYSATTWFLLADPNVLASAIMCFLNGNQSPTIDSADADFDTLGIQFRGYHDFGASMSEYRASVKATA